MPLTEADFPPGEELSKCTVQIVMKKAHAMAFVTAFSMRLKFGLVNRDSPTDDVCCQVAHELQKVLKAES